MNSLWLPAYTLLSREVVRFYRQRSRVIGALGTPILFWIVIGSGFGSSFQGTGGKGYLEYFFPGTLVMILRFTAIFSTISVIEDRNEGFLQGVLVAPVSRASIVLGKIGGASVLALMQAIIFLCLAPLIGLQVGIINLVLAFITFALVSLSLTGLGFIIAWRLNSIQGFHGIMNLLLLPMWLLSGSVFPSENAPSWLGIVMHLNPLTYGTSAVRRALY